MTIARTRIETYLDNCIHTTVGRTLLERGFSDEEIASAETAGFIVAIDSVVYRINFRALRVASNARYEAAWARETDDDNDCDC